MYKFITILLASLILTIPVVAKEEFSSEEIEVMVERYVLSMGKVAKKLLQDSGIASSDIDRIAAELSTRIRKCTYTAISEDSTDPADVETSNTKMELCVRTAFENAGIKSPF